MAPSDPENDKLSDDPERQEALELEELRRLIAGPEHVRIERLRERLEDPELRIKDVSQILAEAIVHRTSQDEKIARALAPTVEKAIETSIKRNRKVLVDALFPVMGPAIRKAVTSAIQGMVQSFDKTLEYSISLKGLRWRIEALRTRKPFGEVVLLHTLLYQVEQVFLIHRKSSLVIQHVVSKNVKTHDPDLVAGMLSAIRDFVQDSFHLGRDESLDTLSLGSDRTIWIEQGDQALLAAVIRGVPPSEFRATLRETLEAIHLGHGEALEAFDGDSTPLKAVRPDLEECLQARYRPKQKKAVPLFWALFGVGLAAIGLLCFLSIRGHRRWSTYLDRLKDVPGIQVTSGEKRSGVYHVYGFRDPLASDPVDLLKENKLRSENFVFHLESYVSTHHDIILERSRQWLESPESVRLEFKDEVLLISGSAPHAWIAKMRKAVGSVAGISRYDDSQLEDQDLTMFEALRKKVEERHFLFEFDSADMVEGQEPEIQAFLDDLRNLLSVAEGLDQAVQIEIVGHADSLGSEAANIRVSEERAKKILAILSREGLEDKGFKALGLGSREPWKEEKTDQDREMNRRVTIRVIL